MKCSSTTSKYLIGGQCCAYEAYNKDGTCTDDKNDNCQQYYHECPTDNDDLEIDCSSFEEGSVCKTCMTGHYLTYAGVCCAHKSYYDSDSSTCETYASKSTDSDYRAALSTCKKFDKNLNCTECDTGTLSDDGQSCCTGSFVNTSKTCVASVTVPTGCKKYNGANFECESCIEGYYLTKEFCC